MSNIDTDWNAACSSEIFREYVKNELIKEANAPQPAPLASADDALVEFEQFENRVRSDPKLFAAFKALQQKFANDPAYRNKTDSKFVEGVLLLNLVEE
jgi:hypothetical protein